MHGEMMNRISGIEIDPDLEGEDLILEECLAFSPYPGEQVRLNPGRQFHEETPASRAAREAACGGKALTVERVIIRQAKVAGYLETLLAFQEVAGEYLSAAFEDQRGEIHLYGLLISRQGTGWFVPLDGRSATPAPHASEPSRVLSRTTTRSARYAFSDEIGLVLDRCEASPIIGEFVLTRGSEGESVLLGVPWRSDASPEDVTIGEAAIRDALANKANRSSRFRLFFPPNV